jgi:alkanesulfonate monooxygenase SsuD/methylene tetrahydromethanopterin reductase-like flavin-dependent oxidoreductase (luciferase family)
MIQLGVDVHDSILEATPQRRRALLDRAARGGLDHVCVGDHVSFHDGAGFDGMVSAAAALASNDRLDVWIAVYQLALRHPLVVARQLASLAQIAPGRITLGVGVGGEDRTEVSNCGVDPATRGRRLDECLDVLVVWCGLDPEPGRGRRLLSRSLEELYNLPFERFEHVCPAGTAADVAEWLTPFVEAGAVHITVLPAARDWEAGIDQAIEVKSLLTSSNPAVSETNGGSHD